MKARITPSLLAWASFSKAGSASLKVLMVDGSIPSPSSMRPTVSRISVSIPMRPLKAGSKRSFTLPSSRPVALML